MLGLVEQFDSLYILSHCIGLELCLEHAPTKHFTELKETHLPAKKVGGAADLLTYSGRRTVLRQNRWKDQEVTNYYNAHCCYVLLQLAMSTRDPFTIAKIHPPFSVEKEAWFRDY